MLNNLFFILIIVVELVSLIAFLVGLILGIFFRKDRYKLITKKLLIYSVISFIIGFECCVGRIVLSPK
ncbi:hypothetical protein BWK59_11800 [Flavobacterium davisii]|uniref:Uncharacterized protein n=1 Tax=Flavobacterium davisii TaxID=2906077 RepID=A0A246GGE2_9FLAO|nr:hypothetical protein BWK59_11800 [Flavobacterium davisii]